MEYGAKLLRTSPSSRTLHTKRATFADFKDFWDASKLQGPSQRSEPRDLKPSALKPQNSKSRTTFSCDHSVPAPKAASSASERPRKVGARPSFQKRRMHPPPRLGPDIAESANLAISCKKGNAWSNIFATSAMN